MDDPLQDCEVSSSAQVANSSAENSSMVHNLLNQPSMLQFSMPPMSTMEALLPPTPMMKTSLPPTPLMKTSLPQTPMMKTSLPQTPMSVLPALQEPLEEFSPPQTQIDDVDVKRNMQNVVIPEKCRVCGMKAHGYNYEVISCNACKMFFRRSVFEGITYSCPNNKTCFDRLSSTYRSKCRACRFEKCLEEGMRHPLLRLSKDGESGGLALSFRPSSSNDLNLNMLLGLLHLDDKKQEFYVSNDYPINYPFLDELLGRSTVGFPNCSGMPHMEMKPPKSWIQYDVLTCIEYFKTFETFRQLEMRDKKLLINYVAMKCVDLLMTFNSYLTKEGYCIRPDRTPCFPDIYALISGYDRNFFTRCLVRTLNMFYKLSITKEEYVLLKAIIVFNPAVPGLSPKAQEMLAAEQRKNANILLKYCLHKYGPRVGPSRFGDILAMHTVLEMQHTDLNNLALMIRMRVQNTPKLPLVSELYSDGTEVSKYN